MKRIVCMIVFMILLMGTFAGCDSTAKDYEAAVNLMNNQEYSQASLEFAKLGDYKDSKELHDNMEYIQYYDIASSYYAKAKTLDTLPLDMDNDRNLLMAIMYYQKAGNWKDAKEKITECYNFAYATFYENAKTLQENGSYKEAISIYQYLGCPVFSEDSTDTNDPSNYKVEQIISYQDAAEQIDQCYMKLLGEDMYKFLTNLSVGDTIQFGTYEQDNDTSNGKEAILWIVLEKQGSKLMLISKNGLDCQPFNTKWTDVTWETCSLRKWLNNDFINNAFNQADRELILETNVIEDNNPDYNTTPGNSTQDKIFLLSITEAQKYFTSDEERLCVPTKYTVSQGAYRSKTSKCWWWLRSPGGATDVATCVYHDGSVVTGGVQVNSGRGAVRPVLWIDLAS